MEGIKRPQLSEVPSLTLLFANWEQWGMEYKLFLDGGKRRGTGVDFSWRQGIRSALLRELSLLTDAHCSFCDHFELGVASRETIEHYEPKVQFPLIAYQWENLYYCCDKCQEEAKRHPFQNTLRPDALDYSFERYFYFDTESGKLEIALGLMKKEPEQYGLAEAFLKRYGINSNEKRNRARVNVYKDIKNYLKAQGDPRTRNDFPYRWIYDFATQSMAS